MVYRSRRNDARGGAQEQMVADASEAITQQEQMGHGVGDWERSTGANDVGEAIRCCLQENVTWDSDAVFRRCW